MFLVTGATGNVGSSVVRALAEAGEHVRALVRPGSSTPVPGATESATGDLNDPASLTDALRGVRGLFLLPGYDGAAELLAMAGASGVGIVVQLSGSSAPSGDLGNAVTAYMIGAERAVRASDVPFTIVRPTEFMSNALRWLPQLSQGDVVRVPFASVGSATIDPYDIGRVVATALLHPEKCAGQVYSVSGPETLWPRDRLRILGEALGRDLVLEAQSDEEARTEMAATMPAAYVDAFVDFYVDGSLDESIVLPTVEQVTGRRPRTFEQWVAEHTGAFTAG